MAGFTEYVRLIAEGGEAVAMIEKINAAIAKMRREAAQPIKFNLKQEINEATEAEKKLQGEKRKTANIDKENFERRKAEAKAIKLMNAEVGNSPNEVRFGSPKSIEQARRFNEQLDETTRRLNRIADAHKHIKQTAKAANADVSASLAERLATQTVGRTEKADAQAIKDAAIAERERVAAINQRLQQEESGAQRLIQMERERARLVQERQAQELEGDKRVIQMEQIKAREAEKAAREQARIVREAEREQQRAARSRETALAASRETGVRGIIGEGARDLRRNMIYGGIGFGEQAIHAAYDANKERDTAVENVRQAGRTAEQIAIMQSNAQKLSMANPGITATEMLSMQQHNIGAFGNFDEAMANNQVAAKYLSVRKGKVGEDEALKENLSILKVGEETGRIRDSGFMKKLYDQQLKIAQAEGAQYNPESLITSVRMLKSSKFGLSDDAMLNLMPFMGMSEGAARIGNQIAMLSKSMTYAGKSISKQNHAEIEGTIFSDGKDGYNKDIQKKFAAGDMAGVGAIVDTYLKQKGFDPTNKSVANINDEMQQVAKAIGNTSAREALLALWANRDQFEKQQRNAALAQGLYTPPTSTRTVQGAQDAMEAQAKNAATSVMTPFNPMMIRMMNGLTVVEQWIAKNPGTAGATLGALGVGGAAAAYNAIKENPGLAANTAATIANTGATMTNTAAQGGGLLKGAGGVLGTVGKGLAAAGAAATVAYAGVTAWDTLKEWMKVRNIINAAKSPEGIAKYNKDTISDDQEQVRLWKAQQDAHNKQMIGQPHPKGAIDYEADRIAKALEAAIARLQTDQKNPLKYKPLAQDDVGRVHVMDDNGRGGNVARGTPSFPNSYHDNSASAFARGPSSSPQGLDNSFSQKMAELDVSSAKAAVSKISESASEAAQTIGSSGGIITQGMGAVASTIAGSGGVVVSALQAIAAQIASVKIQAPAQAGPLGKSDPGPKERGNR